MLCVCLSLNNRHYFLTDSLEIGFVSVQILLKLINLKNPFLLVIHLVVS
jgi:hypothetical protein